MNIANGQHLSRGGVSVAVVGAGRIGSELIRNLGLMGVGRVDVYERERRTADPLRDRYTVVDGDFWDTLTLSRLQEYDFAVCTIGAADARNRMNRKCLVANTSLVHVGLDGELARVGAYPFGSQPDAACAECSTARPAAAVAMPLASLHLTVSETECGTSAEAATNVATASVAGALAAAIIARIVAGSHGSIARTATLDAATGQGTSIEVRRDPHCTRCASIHRPVPIVQTRNRWGVSADLADTCPGMLDQRLQLSDEIDGVADLACSIRELSARYAGGPVPAKFALTEIGGRTICLAFEECTELYGCVTGAGATVGGGGAAGSTLMPDIGTTACGGVMTSNRSAK